MNDKKYDTFIELLSALLFVIITGIMYILTYLLLAAILIWLAGGLFNLNLSDKFIYIFVGLIWLKAMLVTFRMKNSKNSKR